MQITRTRSMIMNGLVLENKVPVVGSMPRMPSFMNVLVRAVRG